jgi:plasmid stabilization system protein ParE
LEKIIWSRVATNDLSQIWLFYAHKNLKAAERIVEEIIALAENLKYPEQYQEDEILGKPYRRMIHKHFKIVYLRFNHQILITNIFDTRQNPAKLK